MLKDTIGMFLFSIVAFSVMRGFLELMVWDSFPGKGYRKYKKQISIVDRWFLISARTYVKDRYLKSEKRMVKFSDTIYVLFVINIVMHAVLLVDLVCFILVLCKLITAQTMNTVSAIFLLLILISFCVFALIENYVHYTYHKKRRGHF